MPTYRAPVDEYRFLLTEVFDTSPLTNYPAYTDLSPDMLVSVVEEAGRLCDEVFFPLNVRGDAEGCSWNAGRVTTPAGFREAFRLYADGGWIGLSIDADAGGQGLPLVLRYAVDEMTCGANLSLAMYPGLTQGAIETLHAHASAELQTRWLPRMLSGEFAGTMCLTEAHAGTDLGLITTRAEPADDGSFRLTGTKIFITAGEHDLTSNIVHLVLAKLPDAPEGSRGISLFLVPRQLLNADGSVGAPNGVTCGSIEHKMGIRGSATCVLNFEQATGWLVGEPNRGLRAMFTMMNGARLGVGLQGLGLAHASYQSAVVYARERLQGRSLSGAKNPSGPADPIIMHADIRRGLLFMRAFIEGARALAVLCGLELDREHRHPDPAEREAAEDLVALLTPVIKALFTDLAFEATNIGMQTLGGHGYVREYGMEQFVRDARIGQIYEGTNHIQALDLVGRKLPEAGGRLLRRYVALLDAEIAACRELEPIAGLATSLADARDLLLGCTNLLQQAAGRNADEAGAAASEYLRALGLVALGHMWLRNARVAVSRRETGGHFDPGYYDAKLATARFYFARMLPQVATLIKSIESGAGTILDFPMDRY